MSTSTQPVGRRAKVLVIEDEPLVSETMRHILSREHDVTVIEDPSEALRALSEPTSAYDVVLCDLMMPKMTGMDLHSEVHRTAPELAKRFVFVTGGTVTPQSTAYLERVDNPRLIKPFRAEELRTLVRRLVGPPS